MPAADYQPPVSQLLSFGIPKNKSRDQWFDYVEAYGFTDEHIPDLIRLASEKDLDWEDERECYSPIHAYRVLGQLKTEDAIQPLLNLLDEDDNDWYMDDLPKVFGMIGPESIPALSDYLNDDNHSGWSKAAAARGLVTVAESNLACRDKCIESINIALSRHQINSPELNGSLVAQLINLRATESVSVIEKAYKEGPMDEMFCGSWARVQIGLGLGTASDFTPEELKHKMSESMKPLMQLAELVKELVPINDTLDFPTSTKLVSGKSGLQQFGKGDKPAHPKSGLGFQKPKEKNQKRKR
jgi:hypothetical protein